VLSPVVNIAIGIVRMVLAPVRYIIRPSIEIAQDNPGLFLAMLATTLGAVFYPTFFISSLLPLAISNFLLVGTMSQLTIGVIAWSLLVKTVTYPVNGIEQCVPEKILYKNLVHYAQNRRSP
jgi:hypothetical protein